MKRTHGLDEREMELVKLLMADCQTTGDIQAKLKKLFAGTIEQICGPYTVRTCSCCESGGLYRADSSSWGKPSLSHYRAL